MGRRSIHQTDGGTRRASATFAVAVDDIADAVGAREEASRLAFGSEVHPLDALEGLLIAPGDLDALLLAYLLDRDPDDHDSPGPAKTIPLPLAAHCEPEEEGMERTAELVLYVVEDSESCARARAVLERTLRHYDERAVRLVIRNVTREPLQPGEDRVIVVPTLVLREPRRSYLAGDVDPDDLDTLLASVGVRRRGG